MNPAVEKLESLLARIAKNRLAPREPSPVAEAPRVAAADVTVNRAATPMPAPVAPSRAATPMPAPVAPVNVAPVASAPTPMPAPVAPVAAKKPEAKTIELELPPEVIEPTRDSEPELELSPVEPVAAKADVELAPLDDDADDDGPEIVAEASGDEPVFVLDDEPEDAEIIEPVRAASTAPAQAQVTEIEITIEPAPSRAATPIPAPAAASTDFDEMSFADVDIDSPPPPVAAPKPKESTPLEAAVQAVGPKTSEAPRPIAPTPAVVAPVAVAAVVPVVAPVAVAAPAVAEKPIAPGAPVEAEKVVAATSDVVRVVAPSKPVEQETFGALMKRSLGLRLR